LREPRANLKTRTYLALFLIAASIATGTTNSIATPVLAGKSSGDNGLTNADENIHDNTPGGFAGQQDINHHEGTCQGGHQFTNPQVPGGCDNAVITDPGKSDDNRQNPKNNP